MKVCPQCAERVQDAAHVCRYCGYDFARGASAPTRKTGNGCLGAIALMLVIGAVVYYGGKPSPEIASQQVADDAALKVAYDKRDRIESMVKGFLKDPSSAAFVHKANGCGYVNSKNSFGGMSGNQEFIIDPTTNPTTVWIEDMNPKKVHRLWRKQCA